MSNVAMCLNFEHFLNNLAFCVTFGWHSQECILLHCYSAPCTNQLILGRSIVITLPYAVLVTPPSFSIPSSLPPRGIQNMHCMMHKCIMVKLGGRVLKALTNVKTTK